MADGDTIRTKFRQSKDYTQAMLVRDLIEYAQEVEREMQKLRDRLTAAGIP